jgi:hypothetical protein
VFSVKQLTLSSEMLRVPDTFPHPSKHRATGRRIRTLGPPYHHLLARPVPMFSIVPPPPVAHK